TLVSGESRTFTVVVLAPESVGTVTATATTSATNDDTPADNQARATFEVGTPSRRRAARH
ncbi:MAG TPA: hypothetical protein VGJ82_13900, partial [Thermoanaerobaculia bacterium]